MLGGWDFLFFFFDVPLGNIKPTSILLPDLPDLLEVVAWRTSLCGTGIADVTPGRLFWWLLHQLGNPFRTIWLLFFQDSLPDSYILRMKEAQDHSYRSDQWLLRFCPLSCGSFPPTPLTGLGQGSEIVIYIWFRLHPWSVYPGTAQVIYFGIQPSFPETSTFELAECNSSESLKGFSKVSSCSILCEGI